jgi:aspartate aminotransferase-like enzyme
MSGPVRFKIAAETSEFEAVARLAYETFVEEIPQHSPNPDRLHVDRFHEDNTYLLALSGDEVVGMLAIRANRPFSLDEKLGSVDPYLPPDRSICELRLLAVRPSHRNGLVFRGLVDLLMAYGRARGYDLAIISGTLRQARLYRHLGFVPFGPLVGTADAPFQPMYITLERFEQETPVLATPRRATSNFLTGPVEVSSAVRQAFARAPVSHRDAEFKAAFSRATERLKDLTGAAHAHVLLGSGTLANDVVAAQLSLDAGPGVVLSNGEFGERLIDHARRFRLEFTEVPFAWGAPIQAPDVQDAIERTQARWLWAVASETSTGMLNDIDLLKSIARRYGLRLCLDCVSAIGAVPLDLGGVALATGASGKAVAALPGLSFVFHAEPIHASPRLPRYLDLGFYASNEGIPFTHSSNLVAALEAALERFAGETPYAQLADLSGWLRRRLSDLGIPVLVPIERATPAVVTIPVPPAASATAIGDRLKAEGLLVAYQSEYLVTRNWLQVGLMGDCTHADVERLTASLAKIDIPWSDRSLAPVTARRRDESGLGRVQSS